MSITVEVNKKQAVKNLKVHYLPFKIDADGVEANMDEYFNNYTKEEKNSICSSYYTNSFRGYPLQGTELNLPQNYKGVVLQETNQMADDVNIIGDRLLRVTGTFDKLYYWNYDKIPSKADNLQQAMQVINIADELSQPISLEEVEKEMAKDNKKKEPIATS